MKCRKKVQKCKDVIRQSETYCFSYQDVFLMIRRQKTTIFTDAKESTTVFELKRIVEGILKRAPEDQRLYKVSPGLSPPGSTSVRCYCSVINQTTAT